MFSSILTTALTIQQALTCTIASIIAGAIIAFTYMKCDGKSKNFAISLVLLPVLVQIVIMMVNGNLGAGVAVAGAFSLVRFRSVPGNSKDIINIFFAMSIGLATGMGYISFALVSTVLIAVIMLVLSKVIFANSNDGEKQLKITIPEDLEYSNIFDDLFKQYTKSYHLKTVKTVNLGSMFQLEYAIKMKDPKLEKEFIDAIRCRNGNLTIICTDEVLQMETL